MNFLDIESLTTTFSEETGRSSVPEGWQQPAVIPVGRYVDKDFFALEVEALKNTWLFGIHSDELPEKGSFITWTRLGQSLVFCRDQDDKVRCFHNICRHRANPLVSKGCGKQSNFVCPVHSWTYGLNGDLKGMPDRRDMPGFDLSSHSLIEVRCENLGKLYFINLDGKAKPLLEDLGDVVDAWNQYQPENCYLARKASMSFDANYKILAEANMEVYHVNSVHPEIVKPILDSRSAPIRLYPNGYSIQAMKRKKHNFTESQIPLPKFPQAVGHNELAQVSFLGFPNRIIAMNDWGYPIINFWPVNESRTDVEVHWISASPVSSETEALWDEIVSTFNTVLNEDFQYSPEAHRNMQSGVIRHIYNNYQERAIYHAHQELDRRIGRSRVPVELAVQPR